MTLTTDTTTPTQATELVGPTKGDSIVVVATGHVDAQRFADQVRRAGLPAIARFRADHGWQIKITRWA